MNDAEIVSMIRSNRPNDVKEWVDYHLAIGFKHITILNHNSSFSMIDLFNKDSIFSKYNNVDIIDVELINTDIPDLIICRLYEDITKIKEESNNFVAFIDDDEYIYIRNNKKINDILNDELGVLSLFWKRLSSSTILQDREGTIIETFNYTHSWIEPSHTKAIINFKRCKNVLWDTNGPHLPHVAPHIKISTINNIEIYSGAAYAYVPTSDFINQEIFIYHYYFQTYADWKFKTQNRKKFNDEEFFNRKMYDILDNTMIDKKKELGI